MRFAKVESIGNDFVLVTSADAGGLDYPKVATTLCTRHFGVGSDGLLVISRLSNHVDLRMFNPDGSEDFCGNGLRCAAVYAAEKGWVGDRFLIFHGGKEVDTRIHGGSVITSLGAASFAPQDIPLVEGIGELYRAAVDVGEESIVLSALTTGSTHTIIEVDELPDHGRFARISQGLEHHHAFPQRTSIIWMRADDDANLSIRIWERGVGETLGCGTGSSAAAVVHARNLGRTGVINVHNPGGTVQVSLPHGWNGPISVAGTARIVFEGDTFV